MPHPAIQTRTVERAAAAFSTRQVQAPRLPVRLCCTAPAARIPMRTTAVWRAAGAHRLSSAPSQPLERMLPAVRTRDCVCTLQVSTALPTSSPELGFLKIRPPDPRPSTSSVVAFKFDPFPACTGSDFTQNQDLPRRPGRCGAVAVMLFTGAPNIFR